MLLVVDNDEDVRATVADYLADAGYTVLQAEGGAQALTLLADSSVRMMISDIRMPEMSGIELAEKAVRRRPELQIILISGFSNQQPDPRWPFLRKPFRGSVLCSLVARQMGRA
jgi:two-component system, cell cycle response regulator CpdR